MKNEMKLEFINKSENEKFARTAVAAFVTQLNPTLEEIEDIKTAVSEAVTNSIVHAYKDSLGTILINCSYENTSVKIIVSDFGCGIEDIELARTPLYTGSSDSERSGLGFTVMETFMDNVEVTSITGQGTTITMTKEIGASRPSL